LVGGVVFTEGLGEGLFDFIIFLAVFPGGIWCAHVDDLPANEASEAFCSQAGRCARPSTEHSSHVDHLELSSSRLKKASRRQN
jgi:hypothetical protein